MNATAKAVESRERPIIFSVQMVRAILEGRKTQTRRVMKAQPVVAFWMGRLPQFCSTGFPFDSRGYSPEQLAAFCPYGKRGDRLWVREAWCEDYYGDPIHYRADGGESPGPNNLWRPSIFMPRKLSRITLEITDVRVERLQEISEADAKAEGMEAFTTRASGEYPARQRFAEGWDSINGKRAPWASNPWVWVITFRTINAPAHKRESVES